MFLNVFEYRKMIEEYSLDKNENLRDEQGKRRFKQFRTLYL